MLPQTFPPSHWLALCHPARCSSRWHRALAECGGCRSSLARRLHAELYSQRCHGGSHHCSFSAGNRALRPTGKIVAGLVTHKPRHGSAGDKAAKGTKAHLVAQASRSLQKGLPCIFVHNQPPSPGRNVLGHGQFGGTPWADPTRLTKCPQVLGLLQRAHFGLVPAAFPLEKKGIQLLGRRGRGLLTGVPFSVFSPRVFPSPAQAIPSPRHRSLPGVWFCICVFLMVSLALLGRESCPSAPGRSHSESLGVLEIFGGMGKACSSAVALCLYPAQTPSASGT